MSNQAELIQAAILKRKEEAFERIRRDLWEDFRKKQLEDQAKLLEARPKPKFDATVLEFPPKLSEQELIRRQLIIDQTWERVVEERRELKRLMERSCHRGPFDSDCNV